MKVEAKIIKCPQCRKPTKYTEKNAFRPFCSERCRTYDQAAWAEEGYRIPLPEDASFDGESD